MRQVLIWGVVLLAAAGPTLASGESVSKNIWTREDNYRSVRLEAWRVLDSGKERDRYITLSVDQPSDVRLSVTAVLDKEEVGKLLASTAALISTLNAWVSKGVTATHQKSASVDSITVTAFAGGKGSPTLMLGGSSEFESDVLIGGSEIDEFQTALESAAGFMGIRVAHRDTAEEKFRKKLTLELCRHQISLGYLMSHEWDTFVMADSETGYNLEEYDGKGTRSLTLSPDRACPRTERSITRSLAPLKAGNGIAIGQSLTEVKARLGKPRLTVPTWNPAEPGKDEALVYVYDGGALGWSCANTYVFRSGKVRAMRICYQPSGRYVMDGSESHFALAAAPLWIPPPSE